MNKKDGYCSVNDQGPAPKMTNTGLKALAKTGKLYQNDAAQREGTEVKSSNQPNERK